MKHNNASKQVLQIMFVKNCQSESSPTKKLFLRFYVFSILARKSLFCSNMRTHKLFKSVQLVAMAFPVTQKKNDLAIRETILGVLNAKDRSGSGKLPASDFLKVLSDFGYNNDTTTAKSILKHCAVDSSQSVDFNKLKEGLAEERKVQNAKIVSKGKFKGVIVAPATPQTSGVVKENKALSREKQAKVVKDVNAEVLSVYKMMSTHEIDAGAGLFLLQQNSIYPTKEFVKLAAEMERQEVSFADFSRALTTSDPNPTSADILNAEATTVFAGACKVASLDRFSEENTTSGRKLFAPPKSAHFGDPAVIGEVELPKPGRKMLDSKAKSAVMGTVFNETGLSSLGKDFNNSSFTPVVSGRKLVEADLERNPDLSRAKQNHGNVLTWNHEQNALEAVHAALEKPSGRKVCCVCT
jgi:hypothetical protein